jgi:hypothetical protein
MTDNQASQNKYGAQQLLRWPHQPSQYHTQQFYQILQISKHYYSPGMHRPTHTHNVFDRKIVCVGVPSSVCKDNAQMHVKMTFLMGVISGDLANLPIRIWSQMNYRVNRLYHCILQKKILARF